MKVTNADPSHYGSGTEYELSISEDTGVSNGRATPLANGDILLVWEPSEDPDVFNYQVYQSRLAQGPYQSIASLPASVTEYTASGLLPMTKYYYRIDEIDTSYNAQQMTSEFFATTIDALHVKDWWKY